MTEDPEIADLARKLGDLVFSTFEQELGEAICFLDYNSIQVEEVVENEDNTASILLNYKLDGMKLENFMEPILTTVKKINHSFFRGLI